MLAILVLLMLIARTAIHKNSGRVIRLLVCYYTIHLVLLIWSKQHAIMLLSLFGPLPYSYTYQQHAIYAIMLFHPSPALNCVLFCYLAKQLTMKGRGVKQHNSINSMLLVDREGGLIAIIAFYYYRRGISSHNSKIACY